MGMFDGFAVNDAPAGTDMAASSGGGMSSMFNPATFLMMLKAGAAIAGKGSGVENAANQFAPIAEGAIMQQASDKKTRDAIKLSQLLGGRLDQVARDPNVTGLNVKPDGSYSLKFSDPVMMAKAAQTGSVIDQQRAAGGQPIPNQQQPNEVSQLSQGQPMVYEAQPGTDRPVSFSNMLGVAQDPTKGAKGASTFGLSAEQVLANEANVRENVSAPIRDAYNMRLSEQIGEKIARDRQQGLIPVSIPGDPNDPEAKARVMYLTPAEFIQYENNQMDYQSALARGESDALWRQAQLESLAPTRQAQAASDQAMTDERAEKLRRINALRTSIQDKWDKPYPGTSMTYGQAFEAGILQDLEKSGAEAAAKMRLEQGNRREEAKKKMIDVYKENSWMGHGSAMKKAEEAMKTFYPDLAQELLGAPSSSDKISVIPPGSQPVPGKLGPNGKKVWRTPDGKLFEEE